MNSTTVAEQRNKQQVATKKKDFPAMLQSFLPEIKRALPRHLNGDRMARIALTTFRRTPALAACDPRSVFAAVIQASQLGLEPDTLGRAYLIPYKNHQNGTMECQFIPGWKGLVELMNRSGQGSVWTGAVFAGDEFDYSLGDSPRVDHRPGMEFEEASLTHVYAVGRPKGSEWPIIEVWPIAKVVKHRDRYNKVGNRHYSYKNMEMYARKVVLLQVLKYMPASAELTQAMELDAAAETTGQHLTVKDAINGTWEHVPQDDGEEPPTPDTTDDTEWPKMVQGVGWTDADGAVFDEKHNGWNRQLDRPAVKKDGTFTARRGAAKHQEAPKTVPAQEKTDRLAFITEELRNANSVEQCDEIMDLIRGEPIADQAKPFYDARVKQLDTGADEDPGYGME